jgi:hypothetical protein
MAWAVSCCLLLPATAVWSGEHRLGGGVNYWVALEDLDEDGVDEDGFSYLVSYQYMMDWVGLQLDVELLPDRFGEDAVAPSAWFLLGKTLYAGAGIGIVNYDGDFADEPFFALRAGLNLEVLPSLYLDISANYRFNDKADLEDDDRKIDADTVFLGAAVRFAL